MKLLSSFKPRNWQLQVLRNLKRFNSILVHRGSGKTELAIQILIGEALTTKGVYAYTAPFQNQIKRNVKWDTLSFPGISKHDGNSSLTTVNGSTIWFIGLDNAEAVRGLHLSGLIIDEVKDVKSLLDTWFSILRPTLEVYQGFIILLGTPKGKGEHYDLHNSFEYKDIISLTDTNLFDIDAVKKGYEDQGMLNTFRQEYLCEWLEGYNRYLPDPIFEEPAETGPYTIGIDLAKKVDWTVVSVFNGKNQLIELDRFQDDWNATKYRLADKIRKYQAKVYIDSTGVGDPITDELKAMGLNVEGYQFTSKSKENLLMKLRSWMHQQKITFKRYDIIKQEIEDFEFEVNANGIRYTTKSTDDVIMSIALGCWGLKEPIEGMMTQDGFITYDNLYLANEAEINSNYE